jgi:hypothetical protein
MAQSLTSSTSTENSTSPRPPTEKLDRPDERKEGESLGLRSRGSSSSIKENPLANLDRARAKLRTQWAAPILKDSLSGKATCQRRSYTGEKRVALRLRAGDMLSQNALEMCQNWRAGHRWGALVAARVHLSSCTGTYLCRPETE